MDKKMVIKHCWICRREIPDGVYICPTCEAEFNPPVVRAPLTPQQEAALDEELETEWRGLCRDMAATGRGG